MTYYCEDCAEWLASNDAKMMYHNGRNVIHRYCKYDRKYRACDQEVFRCGGFVYVRRAILTKICEILNINPSKLFNEFDEVKENYIIPNSPELLAIYNNVASSIANGLDNHPDKEIIAKTMLDSYIIDAEANIKMHNYERAIDLYSEMVKVLHITFDIINERKLFYNLTKIK